MHVEVDLTDIRSREDFHDKMQEGLDCPPQYGRNLDALYDVLTDYSTPFEVNFTNFADFAHELPGYSQAFKDLCTEAMAENAVLRIYFDGELVEEELFLN